MKPESTERTKIIFQDACNTENINAKLGVSLPNEENSIRRYILTQAPILGKLPTISMIRENFSDGTHREIFRTFYRQFFRLRSSRPIRRPSCRQT